MPMLRSAGSARTRWGGIVRWTLLLQASLAAGLLRRGRDSDHAASSKIEQAAAEAARRAVQALTQHADDQSRPLLTVKLVHGLGNQLFQVGALLSTALSHEGEYAVRLPGVARVLGNRSTYWSTVFSQLRPLVVNTSAGPASRLHAADDDGANATRGDVRNEGVTCALEQLPHFDPWGGNCSRATAFVQNWSQPLTKASKCRVFELRGYFQDGAFFANQLPMLRELLWHRPSAELARRRLAALLDAGSGRAAGDRDFVVSIHYRLGDYDPNGWVLSRDYYDEAMQKVKERAGHRNVTCVILSDEPRRAWSRSSSLADSCDRRVLVSPEETDVTSFYMMALTDASVLADSTFSFFSGVLGREPWSLSRQPDHSSQTNDRRRLVIAPAVVGPKAACFSYLRSWPGGNTTGQPATNAPDWISLPAEVLSPSALLADEAMELADNPDDDAAASA
eukprot:TRINITY_DN42224_c0_g1_i1.p1 TRINITY_DN42224_c0_g1~~TRINITY_DN42224_c0_g1_i1.p1  ORF type:complete len:450 (+),score=84.51 TRINITY_DN42224_c0_g1_i1:122-1471(+)